MVVGVLPYVAVMFANMNNHVYEYLMIPLNFGVGIGAAIIWTAQGSYVGLCAIHDAADEVAARGEDGGEGDVTPTGRGSAGVVEEENQLVLPHLESAIVSNGDGPEGCKREAQQGDLLQDPPPVSAALRDEDDDEIQRVGTVKEVQPEGYDFLDYMGRFESSATDFGAFASSPMATSPARVTDSAMSGASPRDSSGGGDKVELDRCSEQKDDVGSDVI
uniref:Uncharacterized protein n=1 Tax=Chromera velia CCMP2878 TaxID=1169474 RepID=A0A0G4HAU7_9ALVE|eukprot:Cvel_25630.t1-p1 / transcript=Cvel_25630.t1 / gene=Cvel_25630 / organism=Chromera_velia_CCMP2878 / gene_product=hypothetical protein / transcript_product=hypothetical protein / location=Cvel_scaffold2931:1077-1727(+) / protein_length=217 / sequence_SO=supercontig / SO=protein_coding / is_pseudo=false